MTKNEKIKGDNVEKSIPSKWGKTECINFKKFILKEKLVGIGVKILNQFLKYGIRRYCVKVSRTVFLKY